ncbi:unnamed protein product [Pieris brassicae]|uniref:Uncharacterized protein n=1 Tax=Pieris brassicae TaxID=7116 RepID=A0A9P0TCJ6_PIEBR|nr:unnamed protein product [Pieris brassicae]
MEKKNSSSSARVEEIAGNGDKDSLRADIGQGGELSKLVKSVVQSLSSDSIEHHSFISGVGETFHKSTDQIPLLSTKEKTGSKLPMDKHSTYADIGQGELSKLVKSVVQSLTSDSMEHHGIISGAEGGSLQHNTGQVTMTSCSVHNNNLNVSTKKKIDSKLSIESIASRHGNP